MVDYKIILGLLAALIAFISYLPYFRDIFQHKTKPHAFTWFVWAVLSGVVFIAQIVENGGAGAWVTGVATFCCFGIFFLSILYGKRDFPVFDWICLFLSFIAVCLWYFTEDPLIAVVLVTVATIIAFFPSFRKSYLRPHEETSSTFWLGSLKFFVSLFALESFIFVNWFYPIAMIVINMTFVIFLFVRRDQLKNRS